MKKKKEFKNYLKQQFRHDYEVQQHVNSVGYFNDWLNLNQMNDLIRSSTSMILSYVKYLQTKSIKTRTINARLNSLRKYFDCIMKLGYIGRNPALGINIGKSEKKVVENPLSATTLNELYRSFELHLDTKPLPFNMKQERQIQVHSRYKLIVSLMIYQGLDTGEIDRLSISDVNTSKGTIYIASKARRYSRVLNLEASQILPMYQYLQSLPSTQDKLFEIDVRSCMGYIIEYIKGIEPQVSNAEHIRQSRMIIWVSTLKLREAQYQIGHKFVSSTEGYFLQDTTELVDEINRLHLFR
jgi:site-specific recombinase XerD